LRTIVVAAKQPSKYGAFTHVSVSTLSNHCWYPTTLLQSSLKSK
jgi:hypothetical protein